MRITPKVKLNPADTMNRMLPRVSPLSAVRISLSTGSAAQPRCHGRVPQPHCRRRAAGSAGRRHSNYRFPPRPALLVARVADLLVHLVGLPHVLAIGALADGGQVAVGQGEAILGPFDWTRHRVRARAQDGRT